MHSGFAGSWLCVCEASGLGRRLSRAISAYVWSSCAQTTGLSNHIKFGLKTLLIIPLNGLRKLTPIISRVISPVKSNPKP